MFRASAAVCLAVVFMQSCATLALLPQHTRFLCSAGEGSRCDVVFYEGGISNAVAIRSDEGTVLFDTKMGWFGERLPSHLAADGFSPVRWIGITHPHCDHLSGLAHYENSPDLLEIWVADTVKDLVDSDRVVAFSGDGERRVGGLLVYILRFSHAHTGGDLVFWLPEKGLLIAGDIFQCGYYPHAERPDGGSYIGLLNAVRRLASLDPRPTTIVGGHGGSCDFAALEAYAHYLEAVIAKSETKPMLGFGTIRDSRLRIVAGAERLSACSKKELRDAGATGWADTLDSRCIKGRTEAAAACLACPDRMSCDSE